jgi:hypothetical protein
MMRQLRTNTQRRQLRVFYVPPDGRECRLRYVWGDRERFLGEIKELLGTSTLGYIEIVCHDGKFVVYYDDNNEMRERNPFTANHKRHIYGPLVISKQSEKTARPVSMSLKNRHKLSQLFIFSDVEHNL